MPKESTRNKKNPSWEHDDCTDTKEKLLVLWLGMQKQTTLNFSVITAVYVVSLICKCSVLRILRFGPSQINYLMVNHTFFTRVIQAKFKTFLYFDPCTWKLLFSVAYDSATARYDIMSLCICHQWMHFETFSTQNLIHLKIFCHVSMREKNLIENSLWLVHKNCIDFKPLWTRRLIHVAYTFQAYDKNKISGEYQVTLCAHEELKIHYSKVFQLNVKRT